MLKNIINGLFIVPVISASVMMYGCVSYCNRSCSDTGITSKNASKDAGHVVNDSPSVLVVNSTEMSEAKIDNMTSDEWLSKIESNQISGGQVDPIDPVVSLSASALSDKRELLEQLNKSNWGSFTSNPEAQELIRSAVRDGALPRSYASGIVLGGYSLVAPTAIIKLVFNPINNQLSLCYMGNGHKNFLFQGTAKGKLSFHTAQIGNKVIWGDAGVLKSKDIPKRGQASINSLVTNPDAVVDWWVSIQNSYTGEGGRFDAVSFAKSGRSGDIATISNKKD